MVNELKLTVVHVAHPNPMQIDADLCGPAFSKTQIKDKPPTYL